MQLQTDGGPGRSLNLALQRIAEISSIPSAAFRIMQAVNDPRSNATDLAEAVAKDPAMSARIIRTVNSAAYGLRTKVRRLADAVTQLGFRRIRNLALATLVCDLFESYHSFGAYNRESLWQHMVGVGVGARLMTARQGEVDPDEAFLAGLLHDIGIILEDQYLHEQFVEIVTKGAPTDSFLDLETRHLGFDHTQLGARVSLEWKFPDAVTEAIAFHHAAEGYDGPSRPIVCAVAAANWVCTHAGIRSVNLGSIPAPTPVVLATIGLTENDLVVFADDIQAELTAKDLLLVV